MLFLYFNLGSYCLSVGWSSFMCSASVLTSLNPPLPFPCSMYNHTSKHRIMLPFPNLTPVFNLKHWPVCCLIYDLLIGLCFERISFYLFIYLIFWLREWGTWKSWATKLQAEILTLYKCCSEDAFVFFELLIAKTEWLQLGTICWLWWFVLMNLQIILTYYDWYTLKYARIILFMLLVLLDWKSILIAVV